MSGPDVEPSTTLKLTVEGKPVHQQRHRRRHRGGTYDPSAPAKKGLAMDLLHQRVTQGMGIFTGECRLEAHYYDSPHRSGQKPDIDNFLKATLDAGNGVLWEDDDQVVQIHASLHRQQHKACTYLVVTQLPKEWSE